MTTIERMVLDLGERVRSLEEQVKQLIDNKNGGKGKNNGDKK